MPEAIKALDVKILNASNNRQAVEDLVNAFAQAGKLTKVETGSAFVRYEAMCPLTSDNAITDEDLSQLRSLGASANVRLLPAP